jgi:hypothetical protein
LLFAATPAMANAQQDPVVAQLDRQKLTASPSRLIVSLSTQLSHHLAHRELELRRGTNAPLRECCRQFFSDALAGFL